MMKFFKEIIKKLLSKKRIEHIKLIKNLYQKEGKKSLIKILRNTKMCSTYVKLLSAVNLENNYNNFYYSIDNYKNLFYNGNVIANLMIDYDKILTNSLNDLKKYIRNTTEFDKDELECINGIELLLDREISVVNNNEIKDSLNGIKNRQANSFKDALQRILFFNQLMWQTGHYLNGLGRLDVMLYKYYIHDVDDNKITRDEAKELLKEFLTLLHKHYYFKSNSLFGDTGQIIILGGYDDAANNVCNELTFMFIELMKELKLPDPKVLLRVNKNTPKEIMELSTRCIQTGIGCPLFANDDVIIPKLIEFGYDENEVYNYGTAACWEPFITGKSFDQNNLKSISFMNPFEKMINNENLDFIKSKRDILDKYEKYLENYLKSFIKEINEIRFGHDPLLSLLTENCIENKRDISEGGAKYNAYGFTGVGLSNVINSIQIIDKYVFIEGKYTLNEFNNIRKNNFDEYENLVIEIKNFKEKYGTDNEKCIDMSNEIIRFTTKVLNEFTNPLGGKYKFGLSAPSYIVESKDFPASFDGRKNGEPFGVHISSDNSNAYTELIQFASKLDYGENRFNGNVVDFFVSPNFIEDNFEKFVDFLMLSIKVGFFEMQMNVVSSKTLIEARKNPEKFPNLIVRVWGFSAYFKDLPDEYKDYIIERAINSEGNS